MAARYRTVDREQLMLLPYDLREWIPENDIVHFVIEAVRAIPLGVFKSNQDGTGDEQYHPHMMLALLLYCYSHGIISSRRIERATWKDVAVRYICGNDHPDHDTICDFRVRNEKAITQSFLQVLLLAKEMKVLKVGTVSIDGTKIKANASINKSICYDRARDLETQLRLEIDELMKKAADSENMPGEEGESLGAEIQRLEELRTKMAKAREKLEERAKAKAEKEKEVYEDKVKRREERKGSTKGCEIKPPKDTPEPSDQVNLTDHESRIMRKSKHSEYTQSYNAQAVVDSEGSMLVLGARVTNNASDSNELSLDVASVPAQLGGPKTVLADKGFASQDPVGEVQQQGIEVLVSVTKESDHNRRKHDWRPLILAKPAPKGFPHHKAWIKKMMTDMETDRARGLYKLRKQTVEPVFGIIKHVLGFRQFLLRGLEKTNLEWTLVTCAYNLKRLAVLR